MDELMFWVKIYRRLIYDRSIAELESNDARWMFVCCLVSASHRDGVLPPNSDLEYSLRDFFSTSQFASLVGELTGRGLLEPVPHADGRVRVRNWEKYQGTGGSNDRVKRHRERLAGAATPRETLETNVTLRNVTKRDETNETFRNGARVTRNVCNEEKKRIEYIPPIIPQKHSAENRTTENRREHKPIERGSNQQISATGAGFNEPNMPNRWEEFIERYPRKRNVDAAARAWVSVVTADNEAEVFAGLDRWLKSAEWIKENGKYVPSPDKWLSNRAWKDHPEPYEEDFWVDL